MRIGKVEPKPFRFLKGDTVEAEYTDPEVESYRDNPLIEALPPIWSREEVVKKLSYFPPFEKASRQKKDHLRFHDIYEAIDLFQPLNVHVTLERRLSRILRMGYRRRNPCSPDFFPDLHTRTKRQPGRGTPPPNSSTTGLHIIGMSGVGKTTGLEKLLLLYPQTILHSSYFENPFFLTQLAWLKIDCPHDGSIKALCVSFIRTVDHLLNTDYFERYGVEQLRNRTAYELLIYFQEIAANHALGVLVIDEIQHLNEAKSGGEKDMMNFFVHLENNLGVPVILVGTYKAYNLLTSEFRLTRRGSGQGALVWDNMREQDPHDNSWPIFLRALQRYQYLREPTPFVITHDDNGEIKYELTDVAETLYYETQGITDFAVKLFLMAQLRAISSGQEQLTSDIISSVAQDSLRLARPALEALREGDREKLSLYEDLDNIDFDHFFEEELTEVEQQENQQVIEQMFPEEEEFQAAKVVNKTKPSRKKKPVTQKGNLLEKADVKYADEFLDD